MGIPVISEFVNLLNTLPSWVKILLFLFTIPMVATVVSIMFVSGNNYVCDTNGEVWQFVGMPPEDYVEQEGNILTDIIGFIWSLIAKPFGAVATALGFPPSTWDEIAMRRTEIFTFNESRYRMDVDYNVTICLYPNGTARPASEFDLIGFWTVYGPVCSILNPHSGENLTIFYNPEEENWDMWYYCEDCNIEDAELRYNILIWNNSIPTTTGGLHFQVFPITCERNTYQARMTLFGVPIFDFATVFFLYFVMILAGVLMKVKALQKK